MSGLDEEQRQRVSLIGETLRHGVETPTDTYITDGIPLLLTRLSQVAPIEPLRRARALIDPPGSGAHNDPSEVSS